MIESGEISVLMPPTFRLKVHHHQSGTSSTNILICLKLTYLLYKKISEKPSGFPRGPSQLVFLTAWQTRDDVTVFCDILWRVWCYQVISARIDMSPSLVSLNMRHRREQALQFADLESSVIETKCFYKDINSVALDLICSFNGPLKHYAVV